MGAGLRFEDSGDDPCPNGDIIMRKKCRLDPNHVKSQFLPVINRDYDLVTWNCQHFSLHFFNNAEAAFKETAQEPPAPPPVNDHEEGALPPANMQQPEQPA